jgi:hypothetical protein
MDLEEHGHSWSMSREGKCLNWIERSQKVIESNLRLLENPNSMRRYAQLTNSGAVRVEANITTARRPSVK